MEIDDSSDCLTKSAPVMRSGDSTPTLLRVGYYRAASVPVVRPYTIPAERQLIELVTEGVVYHETEGKRIKLGCGAMFWHMAGEKTIYLTDRSHPYECLTLLFTAPPALERVVPRLTILADRQRVRELCAELLRSYHDDSISKSDLEAYAYARLLWEVRLGSRQAQGEQHPQVIRRALEFIESEFHRPEVDAREIAGVVGISEAHLYALFRGHVGQTPHRALTMRRMKEAKWRLSGSASAIKVVASDCGFLNIETFYRVFKNHVGVTPNQFRRQHITPVLANP
jgi:AraC-like DNA-binding protein